MQLTYLKFNYDTSDNSQITSLRMPPEVAYHRLKSTGTEDWMGPTAFLHQVVMKVPAPAVGSRFTHRSIHKAPELQCWERKRIR